MFTIHGQISWSQEPMNVLYEHSYVCEVEQQLWKKRDLKIKYRRFVLQDLHSMNCIDYY